MFVRVFDPQPGKAWVVREPVVDLRTDGGQTLRFEEVFESGYELVH